MSFVLSSSLPSSKESCSTSLVLTDWVTKVSSFWVSESFSFVPLLEISIPVVTLFCLLFSSSDSVSKLFRDSSLLFSISPPVLSLTSVFSSLELTSFTISLLEFSVVSLSSDLSISVPFS